MDKRDVNTAGAIKITTTQTVHSHRCLERTKSTMMIAKLMTRRQTGSIPKLR